MLQKLSMAAYFAQSLDNESPNYVYKDKTPTSSEDVYKLKRDLVNPKVVNKVGNTEVYRGKKGRVYLHTTPNQKDAVGRHAPILTVLNKNEDLNLEDLKNFAKISGRPLTDDQLNDAQKAVNFEKIRNLRNARLAKGFIGLGILGSAYTAKKLHDKRNNTI